MIRWLETISGWDRGRPATLVTFDLSREQRERLPHALAATALGCPPHSVEVEEVTGRPPVIVRPVGSGLCLSKASRGPWTAVAIADSAVGVDVECVDLRAEVPWNVLHHDEAGRLMAADDAARAFAFTRLWSLKEAYVKALGVGLVREPASFAVTFLDEHGATIDDPSDSPHVEAANTIWRAAGGTWAAISTVILAHKGER